MSYHSPRVVRAHIYEVEPSNNTKKAANTNNVQAMNMSAENVGNTAPFNYIASRAPINHNTAINNASAVSSPAQFSRTSSAYSSSQFVSSRESQRHFSQRGRAYVSPRNQRHRRSHMNLNNTNTKYTSSYPHLYNSNRSNASFASRERINNIDINNIVSPKARAYTNYHPSTPKASHPASVNAQTPFIAAAAPQQPSANNFIGYNHQNINNKSVTQLVANTPLNITNTTDSEDVIDLTTTMDVPPLVTSPPEHIKRYLAHNKESNKDEDDDDNMTVASSLSPILSPNKTAKRSFPPFESMPINHSMANFEINHHSNNQKARHKKRKKEIVVRKHCYNTRSNTYRATEPIDVDSDSNSASSSDNNNLSSSDSERTSSSETISSLWQSIDFNDKNVEIPQLVVQRKLCPIKGCCYKGKFKNASSMKQHICNIHLSANWPLVYFLCKLCQTLYAEKKELQQHTKEVHDNHDGVQLLLNVFKSFCNNSFEIRCPEIHKCNQRFMVTKQAKSHLRDAHNYHHSDILQCKLPHYLQINYQCILNEQCKGHIFASYHELVAHFRKWHFIKKQNAAKIANILRYKLVNHLDDNYKEFIKAWKEMMTKEGFLIKTKVTEYLQPKQRTVAKYNVNKSVSPYSPYSSASVSVQGANQNNIEIPTREQCIAALRTGIQIDKSMMQQNNNNTHVTLHIEEITDLIMFGCDNDGGGHTRLMLQDLHCIHLNGDGSKKYDGDCIHYSNVINHYFSKHIQNQAH